jgi:hypothetical protein
MSRFLLSCTTKRNRQTEKWWILPGMPMLLLEFKHGQDAPRMRGDLLRGLSVPRHLGFQVGCASVSYNRTPLTTWLLRHRDHVDVDAARRMRIDLSRLHTERETLRKILGLLSSNTIKLQRGAEPSERLQQYLTDASNVFFAEQRYGFNNSEILRMAYGFDDLITEGDRPGLDRALQSARRSVQLKVDRSTRVHKSSEPLSTVFIETLTVAVGEGANAMSERKEVNITNSSVQGSQIAIEMRIGSVTNKIEESAVDDSLAGKLKQLTEAVHRISGQVPQEQADAVTRDLEMFVTETTAQNPRGSAVKRLGQGLIESAKAIGEIAQPIISVAGAIIALF